MTFTPHPRTRLLLLMVVLSAALLAGGCSNKVEREALKKADALIDQKDYRGAMAVLNGALEEEEQNPKILRKVVYVFLKVNDAPSAYRAYRVLLMKPRKKNDTRPPEYRESDSILIDCLEDKDPVVRAAAAKTLTTVRDPHAVNALIRGLKDPDKDVRRACANALGEIKSDKAVDPLIASLQDESWFVRGEAAQSLGKLADARAVEPLLAVLKDQDKYVRDNASTALTFLATEKNKPLFQTALQNSDPLIRFTAAQALARMKDPSAEAILLEYVTSSDSFQRRDAVDALTAIQSTKALPLIRKMASEDPDLSAQTTAILALGLYNDVPSLTLLEGIAKNSKNHPDLRRAAFMAYRKIVEQNPDQPTSSTGQP